MTVSTNPCRELDRCHPALQGMSLSLSLLKEETLLKVTENGPSMIEVINFLVKSVSACETRDFLVGLVSKLEGCLRAGDRCQLPSSKAARVWSAFHRLRVDPDLRVAWANFLTNIHLPATLQIHSAFALQLVVDRLLKKLISMRMDDQLQRAGKTNLPTLTLREQNVVYYMSGYIPVKLIKRFKKRSPNQLIQQKRQMFVRVLRRMRADNQPDDIDTPDDYTRVWADQIDRGGLYQIKPEVTVAHVHASLILQSYRHVILCDQRIFMILYLNAVFYVCLRPDGESRTNHQKHPECANDQTI